MSQICAIHQPNFFPWLGYFEKIRRADLFVFLDGVAYPKSGNSMSSWVNRVRIAVNGEAVWIRAPVIRESGEQIIRKVGLDDSTPWREKILRTLEINYRQAPRFEQCIALIGPLIRHRCEMLADYNVNAVTSLAAALGLQRRFVRQSELDAKGHATELLVNLVRGIGATTYLSGDGAEGYQKDDLFASNGIHLQRLNFTPRPYVAPPAFIPGLSVIDFLMNCEPESFQALVSNNDRAER
jgi:hypothetical protein